MNKLSTVGLLVVYGKGPLRYKRGATSKNYFMPSENKNQNMMSRFLMNDMLL